MKTKSNCASDGSVTLANGFFGVELLYPGNCIKLGLAFTSDIFKLYLVRNCVLSL